MRELNIVKYILIYELNHLFYYRSEHILHINWYICNIVSLHSNQCRGEKVQYLPPKRLTFVNITSLEWYYEVSWLVNSWFWLLDLTSAFVHVMINRLHDIVGISNFALEWVHLYLTDSRFSVFANQIMWVPQGSVLGPKMLKSQKVFTGTSVWFVCSGKPYGITTC